MSTLNTVNITNGTDSITVEGAVKGSAKAWVNFNGTGVVAIRASYNVSSITDNGTGDYTVNFTTALADANYATTCSNRYDAGGTGASMTAIDMANYAKTSSGVRLWVRAPGNQQFYDPQEVSCSNFR
jgi:hypothetical protein